VHKTSNLIVLVYLRCFLVSGLFEESVRPTPHDSGGTQQSCQLSCSTGGSKDGILFSIMLHLISFYLGKISRQISQFTKIAIQQDGNSHLYVESLEIHEILLLFILSCGFLSFLIVYLNC